jgi:oligopeptide transport system permease protein
MASYILRRCLWTLPVLLAVATITFVLMHSVQGGPWSDDKKLSDGARQNLEREYGLDKPLWYQYGKFMIGLAHGDLGISIKEQRNRPVRDLLADKVRVSASLGLLSLALSVSVGIALGVASALRRNTPLDYAAVGFATLSASVPSLILGMLMLTLFTGHYHWLSTSGWGSPKAMIMPVLALSALPAAYISRVTRAAMLDVLDEDYVRTAHAKGLRTQVIVVRHMLRNALIPVLTVTGPIAATLVTGSFVIEQLFSIPGAGLAYVTSIHARDYGVIMGVTLFYAFVVVMSNLVVDVMYAFADPRIRYETHG